MNGGKNMGAVKRILKKAVSKVVGTPKVVTPEPAPAPVAPAPVAPAPVAAAPAPAPVAAPAPAPAATPTATAADPKPTAAETQVAMKKKGRKPLNKTGPKGVLGDATLYKPTLLG